MILMSSDGLHDVVAEDVIVAILRSDADLEGKLNGLVRAALDAGGRDNITVIGVEL
jgi:protein phosphatase